MPRSRAQGAGDEDPEHGQEGRASVEGCSSVQSERPDDEGDDAGSLRLIPTSFRLDEVATPAPGADEVLIRVHAAGAGPEVWHVMTGRPYFVRLMGFGVRGSEAAGPRAAISPARSRRSGARRGSSSPATRCSVAPGRGVCAAAAVDEGKVGGAGVLAPKPANLTFEQAAAVPTSGATALRGLRDAGGIRGGPVTC